MAAVIALNIPTNVADAGQAQLQILIDASAHAQFAPQVNGTATAEYFVVNAPGPTQYSLFNTEIDCSELEPYGYTLEVGTQNLQGATTLEPEVFTDGNWGAGRTSRCRRSHWPKARSCPGSS